MDLILAYGNLVEEHRHYSKNMRKLMEADRVMAENIINLVPAGVALPRKYMVVARDVYEGSSVTVNLRYYLVKYYDKDVDKQIWVNVTFEDYFKSLLYAALEEKEDYIPPLEEDGALEFANDIIDGLLDDFAAWLRDRSNTASGLTLALLEVAAKRL